ncbi:7-cyano-7-deazaguanine synthase [Flagellimonas taeanensis]|uniref:7-cyano-7-deazaguanine synthase n=1 Tax=Flavobacteriaceae TaxID=49546 RepID=UPI000E67C22E|nr:MULTISPECIES: 7-cyano-7-deazaguanine synthase [Allomuricauda]MDC6386297.1 7-cyano-7-deazaguanine synthase [Muricauda sp. SK9]RIV48027.1 7-cyano-7-deazaguanine synthase [Allomuricauda taeanensis]
MREKVILLASGGLDSTTMAFWLLQNKIDFIPVFINYGQHCADTELSTLKNVLPNEYKGKIEIIDVNGVYKYSRSRFIKKANLWEDNITADDLYIPYRNILILTLGASFAQSLNIDRLYSAFINSNHAKEIDCSKDFFLKMEDMLGEYGSVKMEMPFLEMSKFEVAKLGIELNAPIGKTFSCQASPYIPCGACPNCVDRLEALKNL